MKNELDRIEEHLRRLFEERLIALFPGDHSRINLVDALIQAMQEDLEEGSEGQFLAPDRFTITFPAAHSRDRQAFQDILDEMAVSIHQIGLQEGFHFNHLPEISLQGSPEISGDEWIITSGFTPPKPALPDTAAMPSQPENEIQKDAIPEKAFFIIGGKINFALEKAIINIGRHSDNDLILQDPHTSRHHAQLRAINGSYVIFDAGSSSGLFLNGKQVSQATLRTGDVIRLGVTNLIYVQDSTGETPTSIMPVDDEENESESTVL